MTRQEFIVRVLQGERSERIPRALFGAGRWSFRQTGLRMSEIRDDPYYAADRLAACFSRLDTDIIFAGSGLNTFPAEAVGGELSFREGQSPLLSAPIIQTAEDARFLQDISISNAPYAAGLIEVIRRLRQGLPDRFLCATSWGPFTWAMILCDWDLLREKTATEPRFVQEVCDLGVRLSTAFFEPLASQGLIDGIVIPDGAVTLIPNDLYRDVVLPSEKRLFDQFRQRGAACFLHQCGTIGPQLSLYPGTGADCISVDACVPINEVYELYRDRVVTAGNVDVVNVLFGGDPGRIRDAVAECISRVSDPFMRYILMPSCDLPPETPMRNVEEFLASADRTA